MDPHEVALAFARECVTHGRRVAEQLAPTLIAYGATDDDVAATQLYKRVRRLVDYAVRGVSPRSSIGELVEPLKLFAGGPLADVVELDALADMIDTGQPDNEPLIMVLATARARERIGMGQVVDASDLSLIAGMTRGSVLNAEKPPQCRHVHGRGSPALADRARSAGV
jgi:hypothetical protein